MRVIQTRNVNGAWATGCGMLSSLGEREQSRNGDVLVMSTPVTTVYEKPCERVLFCESRDANPFFHLFESIWMLAGRSDATWLDTYVRDFSSRYAEPGGHMHGAYGQRWRRNFLVMASRSAGTVQTRDQLVVLAEMLRRDWTTRRAVLTMWDPTRDLGQSKLDHPCNTQAYFRARKNHEGIIVLDMTILCRSNDIIWGAYGANAVHMSVLLEWMAAATAYQVGTLYQMSHNYHAYCDVFDRILERGVGNSDLYRNLHGVTPSPLFSGEPKLVLGQVFDWCEDPCHYDSEYNTQLFRDLLVPMARAHEAWSVGDEKLALGWTQEIRGHTDWRLAASMWLERRVAARDRRRAQRESADTMREGPANGGNGAEIPHVADAPAAVSGGALLAGPAPADGHSSLSEP